MAPDMESPQKGTQDPKPDPIDIYVPLSSIVFGGEVQTNGTNGVGDLVYVEGHVGPLYIDTQVDRNLIESYDSIPDTVEVRVHLTL